MYMLKNHRIVQFKRVDFMLYKLYPNFLKNLLFSDPYFNVWHHTFIQCMNVTTSLLSHSLTLENLASLTFSHPQHVKKSNIFSFLFKVSSWSVIFKWGIILNTSTMARRAVNSQFFTVHHSLQSSTLHISLSKQLYKNGRTK